MRTLPVAVPRGTSTAEVERLLRRVAAEHGAAVADRRPHPDLPLCVRYTVRPGYDGAGLLVDVAPGRMMVHVPDENDPWAAPCAGRFCDRLAELIGGI